MTTGSDLVWAAASFLGEPYSTAPGRTSPWSGYKDCSGLIAAAYQVATGEELGAYVSSTIFALGVNAGLEIHRDDAFGIPGACLLMPDNPYEGWGPRGHIGFSTGDGFTIESTPAAVGGVQRLPASFQRWGPRACLLPGIDYFGTTPDPEPVPEPVPEPAPLPPPLPDPNEGSDAMGLKRIQWRDEAGDHEDVIGIADDGSVFTTSTPNLEAYYIAGPRAVDDPARPRCIEPARVDQVPAVIVVDGELRFLVQAQGGPDGPGTGVIECYWRRSDELGADGSRWGSYARVDW